MKIYDVFISYRRSDGLIIAEALYKYLTSKGLRVFFDKHEMIDGHYFTTQIENNLRIAPNYILIATDDVFNFREKEDWVRKEIEIAIEEYESNPIERTITVLVPEFVHFLEKVALPKSMCNIADAQRITLPYGEDYTEPFYKALKAVTNINRRNLWFAAHRWLENSKQPGGRFASLNICESILPNTLQKTETKEMPINVYCKEEFSDKKSLMDALSFDSKHFYLIGQGGIGKTTALMHIMNSSYLDKQYSRNAQIPIFIELSFAPDTYGALYEGGKSSFIRRSIYKQVRADRTIKQVTAKEVNDIDEVFASLPYDVAVQPITDILSKATPAPEYLLLLDGLNEVSSVTIEETGMSVVQMIVREIELLLVECPNVRVVLTSRSDESALHNKSIAKLYLSGVDEKNIKEYLEGSALSNELIDKALEDDLFETLQIPLFLTMYASLSNSAEITTQGEILKLFFNERRRNLSVYTMQERLAEIDKNVTDVASAYQKNRIEADMQNFILDFVLPEIAWNMERNNEFYCRIRDIRKIIEPVLTNTEDASVCGEFGREVFSKYRDGASAKIHTYKVAKKMLERLGDDITEVTESIINCCVFALGIMQESNSKYGFVHQHIRDYFAAVKNINTIRLSVYLYEENEKELALECMNKTFKDEPVNYTVRRFIGEYLGEHRNRPYYANEKWNYGVPVEKCDRNLLKRVFDIYRGHFDGEYGYGVYTIVQILKEVRDDLRGSDFSDLDLKLCNLNGHKLGEKGLTVNFEGAIMNRDVFFPNGHNASILSMRFSPEGNFLLTTSKDHTAKLWDLKTGKCLHTFIGHEGAVNSGEFSNDGKYIVTASDDGKAIIWDVQTGSILHSFCGHCGSLSSASFSNDNKYVTTVVLFRFIELWEVESEKRMCVLNGDAERINKAYFSKTGKKIIPCFMGPIKKSKIKMWNIDKKCFESLFKNQNDVVTAAAICPREEQVVYAYPDSTVCIENIYDKSLYEIKERHFQRIVFIEYSLNGDYFVTNSLDNIIRVFNNKTGECISTIKGRDKLFTCISINNSGNRLSVASDSNLYIYDLNSKKCFQSIKGTNLPISDISFSLNGEFIAVSINDMLSIWNSEKIEFLYAIKMKENIRNFSFDQDNDKKIAISLSNHTTLLLDLKTMDFEKIKYQNYCYANPTCYVDEVMSSYILTKQENVFFVRKNGFLNKKIKNIYGIMMKDTNLSNCHSQSFLSKDDRIVLSQYGVIV